MRIEPAHFCTILLVVHRKHPATKTKPTACPRRGEVGESTKVDFVKLARTVYMCPEWGIVGRPPPHGQRIQPAILATFACASRYLM